MYTEQEEAWLQNDELFDEYRDEVRTDRDSYEHKKIRLENWGCFIDWCHEKFSSTNT